MVTLVSVGLCSTTLQVAVGLSLTIQKSASAGVEKMVTAAAAMRSFCVMIVSSKGINSARKHLFESLFPAPKLFPQRRSEYEMFNCGHWNSGEQPELGKSVVAASPTFRMEATMPVLLIPVLWVAGSAVVLGGGYYIVAHIVQ